jgi:hypothetical protein
MNNKTSSQSARTYNYIHKAVSALLSRTFFGPDSSPTPPGKKRISIALANAMQEILRAIEVKDYWLTYNLLGVKSFMCVASCECEEPFWEDGEKKSPDVHRALDQLRTRSSIAQMASMNEIDRLMNWMRLTHPGILLDEVEEPTSPTIKLMLERDEVYRNWAAVPTGETATT